MQDMPNEPNETLDHEPDTGVFRPISEQECRELLDVAVIGRLGFDSSAGLQILPFNCLFENGCIYARVDPSSVLAELADGVHEVAFEADHHDDTYQQAWSVLVQGSIEAVTDDAEIAALRSQRRLQPWAVGDRSLFLRLTPQSFSGRKVIHRAR